MLADEPGRQVEGAGEPIEPSPEVRRRAHRLAWLYTAAVVILLPWIGLLAVTLPRRQFDLHYRVAWVGFDLLLVFAITRTAYMAFPGRSTRPAPGHSHGHAPVCRCLV
jgi:hypothetical protein